MKLYEKVFEGLSQRIDQGYYQPGDKLPSIRAMSQEMSVSISTIQEAYQRLEEQGYAESRPKSGYYVRSKQTVPQLPDISQPVQRPLEVTHWDQVYNLLAEDKGPDHVALGTATPDIAAPTLKPLTRALAQLSRENNPAMLAYCGIKGSLNLRKQIARLSIDSGCNLHPDSIIITTGCQEALVCALRATTSTGDIVATDSPSFYGSTQAIKSLDLKALEIPTHPETGISLEALKLALDQWPVKAIQVTPTCNNPLGYTMPEENRRELLRLAQQYDIPIIEDDIYGDLFYGSPRPRTIKSYDEEGRVLLCSSLSKTVAPGLRIGWVSPGQCTDRVLHKKFVSTVSNPLLQQEAVAEFISQGGYERHLRRVRQQYKLNRDKMIGWIERYFPERSRISFPSGGYLLWVELPETVDTVLLNKRLKGAEISFAPGVIFSASGKYRNCMRLNYAANLEHRYERALATIGNEIGVMLAEH